jgi:hypothetical protein
MGLIETACLVVGQSFPSHDREFPSRRKAGLNGICHAMGNKRAELMIAAVGKRPTGLLQDHFHAYCGATELRQGALLDKDRSGSLWHYAARGTVANPEGASGARRSARESRPGRGLGKSADRC